MPGGTLEGICVYIYQKSYCNTEECSYICGIKSLHHDFTRCNSLNTYSVLWGGLYSGMENVRVSKSDSDSGLVGFLKYNVK